MSRRPNINDLWRSQSGMSMLEVVLSALILAVIGFASANFVKSKTKYTSVLSKEKAIMKMDTLLNMRMGCAQTVEQLDECNGEPIEVLGKKGLVLIKNTGTGTKYDRWTFKAHCSNDPPAIVVSAAKLKKGEPLTATERRQFHRTKSGTVLDWSRAKHQVLKPSDRYCGAELATKLEIGDANPDEVNAGGITYVTAGNEGTVNCDGNRSRGTAECAEGTVIVSGGARCYGTHGSTELNESYPDQTNNRWVAQCCDGDDIDVYAVCKAVTAE